jgi:hypothetical protein
MNASEQIAAEQPEALGTACLNCGARLTDAYCAKCGQRGVVPRSLTAFLGDFIAGLMNFEGKFWRTLPMLAWRPGELTRRYVDGQRSSFISPVALYLFTVFLMFAVLNFSGGMGQIGSTRDFYATAIRDEQLALQRLEAQRRREQLSKQDLAALDQRIASARSEIGTLVALRAGRVSTKIEGLGSAPPWVRDAVGRAVADPQATMSKIQDAASKYSWLLIPLSVPVLRLLFPLRRRLLYDHTVFVTYSLSFAMLLIIVGSLLVMIGASAVVPWLALVPPVHMYRQLRGAYGLGRWGALLRTAILSITAMMVLIIWALVIVALGALG